MLTFTVSRYYEIVTPESAEHGDVDERGEVFVNDAMDFRDTIKELRECNELSDSHVGVGTWAMMESYASDYRTGEMRSESVHIKAINGHKPTAHQLKRLFKAARIIK